MSKGSREKIPKVKFHKELAGTSRDITEISQNLKFVTELAGSSWDGRGKKAKVTNCHRVCKILAGARRTTLQRWELQFLGFFATIKGQAYS